MSIFLPGGMGHLTRRVKLGFGVGHVLNDLCASMWFTYLLLYLQFVLQLDKGLSGTLLMIGQIADAIATPIVGVQSDKGFKLCCFRYGRRKTWHLLGTICVLGSFPFIFIKCVPCFENDQTLYVAFIGIMICIFQFGWASCQVSHLALIPDLTPNEQERDELNIIRYFFDVLSDVFVYIVVWVTFAQSNDPAGASIDPGDYVKFQIVTVVVIIVGAIFSVIFHTFTPEATTSWTPLISKSSTRDKDLKEGETENDSDELVSCSYAQQEDLSFRVTMTWKDWLSEPQFYQIGLIYACSRLVANLANIYMPIYLQATLKADEQLTALIPLVMSLSGVAATIIIKLARKCVGKRSSMVFAIIIGIIACGLSGAKSLPEWGIYCLAVLWGLSGSIMIILSLAFTADLIGYCTDSSAFVYGSMSCGDKLINGFVVFLIQELTKIECNGDDCGDYYRRIMSVGIFGPLLVGLIGIGSIASLKLGKTRKIKKAMDLSEKSTNTSNSSDSSEILIPSDIKMGYGAISKL